MRETNASGSQSNKCVQVCVCLDEEEEDRRRQKIERKRDQNYQSQARDSKISKWIRLSPASVLPCAATEIAPTPNSKVTTCTHTKRKLFPRTFFLWLPSFLIQRLLFKKDFPPLS